MLPLIHPAIGIIVPAYNAENYLARTLGSVLSQTYPHWELLIVDDGSTDGTHRIAADYAASDSRIRLLSQPNAGVSAARNAGFEQSCPDTEFIIFLDADDVWEPHALAILLDALSAHPEAAAAYGLAHYIDKNDQPIEPGVCEGHQQYRLGLENGRVIVWPPDRPTTFAVEAVMERVMTCGTVLIRRKAFQSAGRFDPALRMWEDWDYWLRLARVGDLIFTNTPVLGYRRHDANMSSQLALLEAGEWRVRHKLLETVRHDPASLLIARQALAYRHRCAVSHRLQAALLRLRKLRLAAAVQEMKPVGLHFLHFLRFPKIS